MRTRRLAVAVTGLAVLLGVLGPAAPAHADPYWRVQVTVTPGASSCTVGWVRSYWDGPVSAYKIWVVPQNIAPGASQTYRKVNVTPPAAGRATRVRVGSLTRGAPYVFWLEAFYPSYFRSGQVSMQVATSRVCKPT
ncbi:fibronectin type III domain-containing protein [Cryptosporangium aurantiacum]|uniref:Fibronectin type-III domain-containing protein n=1 Tax=Cryptosporangium aurantiacum TaxID=134849 RepID=A0A1M7RIS2_9ACTN|nr:hypothetical protein [Cryptosporangium aurantiacum]SHN46059.1 hypothetical protein SAMN05443668_113158 [Cryptosporangium aurantiacum]